MTRRAFSNRALWWLAGLGALSFAAFLAVLVFGEEWGRPPSYGTDAYSRSALGHAGFVAWARRAGYPVLVSRWRSDARAREDALLVVAEPEVPVEDDGRHTMLDEILAREGPVLLVLPKRRAVEDEAHAGWVDAAPILEASVPDRVLSLAAPGLTVALSVVRPAAVPDAWDEGPVDVPPTLLDPQFLRPHALLVPVVASRAGLLVARADRAEGSVWILSDPDVLANHGLGKGDNAVLLARVLAQAVPEGGAIVVDETLHGYSLRPSIARELFRWPLVLAVLQAALAAAALVYAAIGRHGAPAPVGDALPAGKAVLLENTADLLHSGGHHAHALRTYLAGTTQQVLRATHAPAGLARAEADEWIARAERARGVRTPLAEVREAVATVRGERGGEAARAAAVARGIHGWRREMIDGSHDGS